MSSPDTQPAKSGRQSQYGNPARLLRGPLKFSAIGGCTKVAEENGRTYKIEYLGLNGSQRHVYRATAQRGRTRQVIATKDCHTSHDAERFLDTLRIAGSR